MDKQSPRSYEKPELKQIGTVEEITLGSGPSPEEDYLLPSSSP